MATTSKKRRLTEERTRTAGLLEQVELIDFMCHRHFQLDLGPNMNFIVGANGSGKSSILVALVVGMGAKASFTHRGHKLGDLVRSGANSATIRLTLANRGAEAWRSEEYGDHIVVERSITREGQGHYRLKNSAGRIVSRNARHDLQLLLEHFNILTQNPCTILMQDTSREFLVNASPKDKYRFWHTATQLEQMRDDLKFVREQLTAIDTKRNRKLKQHEEMKKKLEEYKNEYMELQSRKNLQDEIRALKVQLAWTYVAGEEQQLETARNMLQHCTQERTRIESKQKSTQEQLVKEQQVARKLEEDTAQIVAQLQRAHDTRAALDEGNKGVRKEQHALQVQLSDAKNKREHLYKRLARLEREIAEAVQASTTNKKGARDKRAQEIARLQTQINELERKQEQNRKSRDEAHVEMLKAVEENKQVNDRATELDRRRRGADERVRELEQRLASPSQLSPSLVQLQRAITANHQRFQRTPVGPVGALITVLDPKYIPAVEYICQQSMLRFICATEDDDRVLKELAQQCGAKIATNLDKRWPAAQVQDTRAREPDPTLKTVLRLIKSDEPLVINHLIMQFAIESVVVCDNPAQAQDLLFTKSDRSRNIKLCVLPDGTTLKNDKGSQSFDARSFTARFLVTDVKPLLQQRMQERNALVEELATVKQSQQKLYETERRTKAHHAELQKEGPQLERQLNQLRVALNREQQALTELEQESQKQDISELENNKLSIQNDIKSFDQQVEQLTKKLEQAKSSFKPQDEEVKRISMEIEVLLSKSESFAKTLSEVLSRSAKLEGNLAKAAESLDSLRKSSIEHQAKIGEQEAIVATAKEKAQLVGNRPQLSNKSAVTLQREIEAKQKRAEQEARGKKSPEQIVSQYNNAKTKYTEVEAALTHLERFQKDLKEALMRRLEAFKTFRKILAKRTRVCFNMFLSQRNYSGSITFNHEEELLEVEVQLDPGKAMEEARDTRSLSGGERSFSTVAFLLSVWQAIEAPFYALDEFDVFMDAVHRRKSVDLLVEHGRGDGRHNQFLFITPQNTDAIPAGSADIRITKMRPPERDQGTLPFSQR